MFSGHVLDFILETADIEEYKRAETPLALLLVPILFAETQSVDKDAQNGSHRSSRKFFCYSGA